LNVLWLLLDVTNVENLDLMEKLIFVQIVAIELQRLLKHLSEIRKVTDPNWNIFYPKTYRKARKFLTEIYFKI